MPSNVKVTLNEKPPAVEDQANQAVESNGGPVIIPDSKGRRLKLEEPDILAPYRLVEIVGAESAENRVYMSMVFPLLYIAEIDGEPIFAPNSKRELEALIKRLGHEGIKALREGVEKNFGVKGEEARNAAVKK